MKFKWLRFTEETRLRYFTCVEIVYLYHNISLTFQTDCQDFTVGLYAYLRFSIKYSKEGKQVFEGSYMKEHRYYGQNSGSGHVNN